MSLSPVPIGKNKHVYARIYFISLKNFLNKFDSVLIPNFDLSEIIEIEVTK